MDSVKFWKVFGDRSRHLFEFLVASADRVDGVDVVAEF